jgi:hypothetical protein
MDRDAMTKIAETVIARQDDGDVEGIVELFAEDCTFAMPVLADPIRSRDELRDFVRTWPRAVTNTEWVAIDADGLIRDYEDWFDPNWATPRSLDAPST